MTTKYYVQEVESNTIFRVIEEVSSTYISELEATTTKEVFRGTIIECYAWIELKEKGYLKNKIIKK